MVQKFVKKPVVIEAAQFTIDKAHDVYLWVESHVGSFDYTVDESEQPELGVSIDPADGRMVVRTLEGNMKVSLNDWVIRGVNGEFYPCKPDIFEKTYDPWM